MKEQNGTYPGYPVFKGLQRPLEFMGIRGRYIYWAAGIIMFGLVLFIVSYIIIGFIIALILLTIVAGLGIVFIFFKQRNGLHSKKKLKGIFIYKHSKETIL